MSLFTKLFKKRKDHDPLKNVAHPLPDVLEEWDLEQLGPSIPFRKSQLRIVVFQESERRGRQVLFDSANLRSRVRDEKPCDQSAVVPNGPPDATAKKSIPATKTQVPNGSTPSSLEEQRKTVAQTMRPNRSDIKMLGEMIFGSIPIAVRNVITKVHELRSPPHIMLTKVYPVFVPLAKDADSEEDTQGRRISESRSSISSEDSLSLHSPPSINAIPERLQRRFLSAGPSPILTPSHSSSSLSSLTFSPPKTLAPFSGGGSFQKRWRRNHSTSIDNSVKYLLENENNEDFPDGHTREKKKIIAVACLVSLPENNAEQKSFQEFFFTHCPIFEHAMNLFKAQLEKALSGSTRFGEMIVAAYEEFTENLVDFIVASRLPRPMWMVIAMEKIPEGECSQIAVLRLRLIKTLAELWIRHDTKETQFFVSRLLTAVLTGHLGWVSTVTPTSSQTDTYRMKHEPTWIQPLAKSHPYNPLWAQLGDLLGLCGTPGRLTKTVVVSKNQRLLSAYLHFLSYFIRTTDVLFHRFEPISAASSIEESSSTVVDSPDISRARRYYSGDNGFRSSGLFNKCKRTSGARSRVPSFDDQNVPRHSRHSTTKTFSQESSSPDQSVFDSRSRHTTAEGYHLHRTNSVSRSLAGISHVASRSSIAEEIYPDNATDANKLQTVCQVAATVLSTVKEAETGRYRRYTTSFGRHDATEKLDRDFYRAYLRTYGQKILSISKFPEKPLILHVDDVPIPRFKAIVTRQKFTDQAFENTASFATSMLAAPRKKYTPFFALQGCTTVNMEQLSQDLQVATENGFTDEMVSQASAIVANLDDFTVRVVSCSTRKYPPGVTIPIKASNSLRCRTVDCQGSGYIMQVLESTASLWKLKTTPEFCLTHLEDRMQEIYLSSCAMVSFIQHQMTTDIKEMMELLGLEMSDFPLVMAVATTHAPEIMSEFA